MIPVLLVLLQQCCGDYRDVDEGSINLLLVLQAFPALLAISAYYYLLQYLNLLDSAPLLGLSLIYMAGSVVFSCWNIKGYFDTLPIELDSDLA